MSGWISVDDRMPEMTCDLIWVESEWVLTYGAQGPQLARLRRLDDEPSMQPEWIIRGPDGWTCEGVTHWQPITPPQVAANTSILTGGDGCGKPVPPSAPVGVEGLVAKWRNEIKSLNIHPAGLAARRVCAGELERALEVAALAAQPGGSDNGR